MKIFYLLPAGSTHIIPQGKLSFSVARQKKKKKKERKQKKKKKKKRKKAKKKKKTDERKSWSGASQM